MAKKGTKKPMRRKQAATKDETVEVRTAGIGDNSELKLPKPDDYAHHMKSIRGAKDKLETAKSLLSHAKTAANKSCPGLAASIGETLAIERDGDAVKLKQRFELLGMGLKQINSTVQLSVFDTLAGEVTEQAFKRGYADGKAGKGSNSGYPEGSDLAAEYSRGWQEGMSQNVSMSDEDRAALNDQNSEQIAAE